MIIIDKPETFDKDGLLLHLKDNGCNLIDFEIDGKVYSDRMIVNSDGKLVFNADEQFKPFIENFLNIN
jgi:hypothetical protein